MCNFQKTRIIRAFLAHWNVYDPSFELPTFRRRSPVPRLLPRRRRPGLFPIRSRSRLSSLPATYILLRTHPPLSPFSRAYGGLVPAQSGARGQIPVRSRLRTTCVVVGERALAGGAGSSRVSSYVGLLELTDITLCHDLKCVYSYVGLRTYFMP